MSNAANLTQSKPPQVIMVNPQIGCDPELFFTKNGEVIGAEKILPTNGEIQADYQSFGYSPSCQKIVLDGVQVELNPAPDTCRARLGNKIKLQFQKLKERLDELKDDKLSISFSPVVEVSKQELDSLSEKARALGCAPSLNRYNKKTTIKVNAAKYLKRSAGGHIHLGISNLKGMKEREKLVPILDILVGIPSVMIDRDPSAAERRKVYGRAGEYRLPQYGLEYRTLSNFWLRAYPLASLMWAQARNAVSVNESRYRTQPKQSTVNGIQTYSKEYWDSIYPKRSYLNISRELLKRVDLRDVRKAINKNDLQLALKCFEGIADFINNHQKTGTGLTAAVLPEFRFFCEKIWEYGLDFWFPDDPLKHWTSSWEGHTCGWEWFVTERIKLKMNEANRMITSNGDATNGR